jgi:hypothetical protein
VNDWAAARERIVAFVRPGKPSCARLSCRSRPSSPTRFPCNLLAISHKLRNNSLSAGVGAMRILGIAALCAALAGCASGPSRPLLAQNEFSGSTPPVYQPPPTSEPYVTCPDGSIATSQEICAVAITEAPPRQHPAQSARAATRITSTEQPGPRPAQTPISAPAISASSPPAAPPATDKREAQVLSAVAIVALIVKESRSAYYATGRPCACPDDRMRNGHACGGRSAYSRPGGAAPLCYPADVSTEMISNYRARLAQR